MTLGKTYKLLLKTRMKNTIDEVLAHGIKEVNTIKARGRRFLGKMQRKQNNGIMFSYDPPSEEIIVNRKEPTDLKWLLSQYESVKGQPEIPRGVQAFSATLNGINWIFKKTTRHRKTALFYVEYRDGVAWDNLKMTKDTLKQWAKELRGVGILTDICEVPYTVTDRSVCPADKCIELIPCEDIK